MSNKVFATAIALLYVSVLMAQVVKPVTGKTAGRLLPTRYATILYASQVSDTSGANKLVAAHFINRGGGIFTWQKNVADAGLYEIAISYATRLAGSKATIAIANSDSCSAILEPTTGYYMQQENWYQFNCERRQVPGQLRLLKGLNTISLRLSSASDTAETSLYSIELIPVAKKSAIENDRRLARQMAPSGKWFADAGYGVMFHWTSQSAPEHGNAKPYMQAVRDFDVPAFVAMVEKTGAAYVIFTTNHAEPYFPAPLHTWEKVYPGHTADRDLIEEIADGLGKHNIKLFLYMATHVYAKYDSVNDEQFDNLNYSLVKEIGERYKEKVAGYWFDGWYQSYEKHPHFDFEKFYRICKAGNAQRLVSLNTWLYPVNTLWQDYWAGEVYTMGTPPADRVLKSGPGNGLPSHNLIVMEKENWFHDKLNRRIPPPDLRAVDLIRFIRLSKGKGPVTINMQIYQDGRVGEEALSVMEEVKKEIRTANAQVVLVVSPKGNDHHQGTLERPYKTLEKALSVASRQTSRNVYIQLRGGTYYLNKTIRLQSDSISAASIRIMPYNNEKVSVSAGRRLLLAWKKYRDGIYQAQVPAGISFERLYIDGKLQAMARYPNYDSSARVFHGTSADAIAPERVKTWKHPEGGYVHALHAYEWGGFHYRITGADNNGNLKLEGGWQNNRPNKMHKEYRFVENIFEELDAPGEWWLDKTKRILYYYPASNVDLSTAMVQVSHLKNSIELLGSADKPVHDIQLQQLDFLHNERTFMDTREPLVRSDWTIYRGGALLLQGTERCNITDCTFSGIGGNAVMFSGYNSDDTVSGCHIWNIGANAVCFIGDTKSVRSPSFGYENYIPYEQLDKTPGPLTNNYPRHCVVTDNLLHNLGEIEKQATGVEIEISSSITVSHNTIYNTPRAGLNIGDGCFGGHLLEYNDVFNTVLETGDHGAFNSWGRDRYWSPDRRYMDSIVAAHPDLVLLDAQKQTVIRNNRFRCDHGWDIDLDDGSSNYAIYNNLCLNGGLKLREGFYRIVENNILINNSFHPHVWFKNSGDVFARNIVTRQYFPIQITHWGKQIDYNFFPDTAALNLAHGNGTDAHSLAGDPDFSHPEKGDYTVAPGSPALATGFKNFPMNAFGVRKPSLKKIALTPPVPVLMTKAALADKSAVVAFLGGRIKSVDGLPERSAYGLPDAEGVIVMAAGQNSLLSASGLKDKDVIRAADGRPVRTVEDLLNVFQSSSWKGKIEAKIIRNQQPLNIILRLK